MSPDSSSPEFTILYFAAASSYTSLSSERFPAPLPLSKLFASLEARHPGFEAKVLHSCAVTVNLEYVDFDGNGDGDGDAENPVMILPGDEVALIPPVSSG